MCLFRELETHRDKYFATEKTSWLNLARAASTGDQWRQATCRMSEEGESCLLNVYIDVSGPFLDFSLIA